MKSNIVIPVFAASIGFSVIQCGHECFRDHQELPDRRELSPDYKEKFGTVEAPTYSIVVSFDAQGVYDALLLIDHVTTASIRHIRSYEYKPLLKQIESLEPEQMADDLFYARTRKPFPDSVTVQKEDLPKDRVGQHDAFLNKVSYEKQEKVGELSTLLHEYGHVITQHQEQWEDLSSVAMNDWEERNVSHILEYAQGNDDEHYHNEGYALTVATFQVLEDPYATFTYLATLENSDLENLDPKIVAQMNANNSLLRQYTSKSEDRHSQASGRVGFVNADIVFLKMECIDFGAEPTQEDEKMYTLWKTMQGEEK